MCDGEEHQFLFIIGCKPTPPQIEVSNIDHNKVVNTLSNPKLHAEFMSNNHLGCIMKGCVEHR